MFCSAHWFDYHETGIVAEAFYQGGFHLIDVRDPADLQAYGYAYGGASEVWDAYWIPRRDAAGVQTGSHTNFAITADAIRGLDVFEVDLPDEVVEPLPATDGDTAVKSSPSVGVGTLVLVDPNDLSRSAATEDYLTRHAAEIETAILVGGPVAIAEAVRDQVLAAIRE